LPLFTPTNSALVSAYWLTKIMAKQRLQKILAEAGIASRRKCEQLILEGSVRVNRKVLDSLPAFADPEVDLITINGRKIRSKPKVYFLLNKPKGVICTSSDPQGRKKAIDLIPTGQRIFCAGRLDVETTGAIIVTNDSALANKLTHPRFRLAKTYIVRLHGQITGDSIEKLKKGIWLSEGKTHRSSVKILKRSHKESVIEITIRQGLNRQVRRMLAKVGHKVVSLKRTHIGKISTKGLSLGKSRKLTNAEITYLQKITRL